jgi:hypothetical protein
MRRYQNGIVDGAVINAMLRAGLIDFNEAVKLQNAVANPSQPQEEAEGRPKKGATIGSDGKVIDKDGKPISGSEGGPGAGKRFKT